MKVAEEDINKVFSFLNTNQIRYLLLRNIGNELPNNFIKGKDIDILVNPDDKQKLIAALEKSNWIKSIHPWDFGKNFVFLYSMDQFIMYSLNGIHLDICFQLCCRSLNAGEWFPLDSLIQEDAFSKKKVSSNSWKYSLSTEIELIHLLTRCVFDKKDFSQGYIYRIEQLKLIVDWRLFKKYSYVVFYKFTDSLIELILKSKFQEIRNSYITFKEY